MNTPICDFIREYKKRNGLRLHMPGHKGIPLMSAEADDITEVPGADSLYEADGIIAQSEANAGSLFGCTTLYSTEGSSHCIRAMLYLAVLHAVSQGKKPIIAAGRNSHKTFLSAAVLLDFGFEWLLPEEESYLSCKITPAYLDDFLSRSEEKPTAVYITSPDYTGNITDIASLSQICKKHDALLLVDNAHGAYLGFLSQSLHPIHSGADLCCDSAHKTLPALTGGAYLHISSAAPELFRDRGKSALALFGSTSPSYLIMQSLDAVNLYLSDGYKEKLESFIPAVDRLKSELTEAGYTLSGDEPLKLVLCPKAYGYTGTELAEVLSLRHNIICEFADPDFTVLMLAPEIGIKGLTDLGNALKSISPGEPISVQPPRLTLPERIMSPRAAAFLPCETVRAEESSGRILSKSTVSCPPAVPIIMGGERIDDSTVAAFAYYGVQEVEVLLP